MPTNPDAHSGMSRGVRPTDTDESCDVTDEHGSSESAPQVDEDLERARAWREDASRRRSERLAAASERRLGGLRRWLSDLPPAARWGVVVPTALVAVLALSAVLDVAVSFGRIHPGVRVAGVPVGALTPAEARDRLARELGGRLGEPVTLRLDDKTWKVTADTLLASVDTTASVRRAAAVGTTGPFLRMVAQRFGAVFGGADVTAAVRCDPQKLSALLDEVDAVVSKPASDAKVTFDHLEPRLTPAVPGIGLARDEATAALLAAFVSDRREVRLRLVDVAAHVSDADARQALADAKTMVSGPVVIEFEKQSWTVEPTRIVEWISFRNVAPSGAATGSAASERMVLQAYVEASEVSATVLPLAGGVGRPPVNARFVVEGGRVVVSGGQVGLGPDIASLSADLEKVLRSTGDRRATLRLATLQPALTAETAKSMGIVERISTYTTTYKANQPDRVNNIHTLADALNDKLVPPGGVFDFNATVGERTAAKGYREAPAIVNGKLVPQLGGGICQIGTTFFNAVFFSGLPVVERRNHSFYISHYPKGRDCTVTWGGPNLRWRNETSSWVLIKTSYTNSSVTIALYGTSPGYDVTYTTSDFANVKPFPIKEVPDPTVPVPKRIVEDAGVAGGTVTVVRTVSKAGQVVRTDTFVSYYKPKEETVRVGTKVTSTPATTTPTP